MNLRLLARAGCTLELSTVVAFVASLFIQVGYPLALALMFRRRTSVRWQVFAYGAIVYAVFQLFTWLPLSVYLDVVLGARLEGEFLAFIWLMASAFLASLIEELGRLWGYRVLFPSGSFRLTWRNGVMYGLGHSALETMLLIAGLTFVYFLAYLILNRLDLAVVLQSMGAEASPALAQALKEIVDTSWVQPLIVALERILALPHQVAWSLLVLESLICRQKRWFVFAVLYHFSVAVIVPGLARLFGFAVAEGVNLLLACLSVWIILKLRAVSGEE
jgi:uncharacterized membrane protein YhfC